MHRVEFVFGSYKVIKSNRGFRRRINSQLTKLLFPGPAFIWSLFALFQTSKMAPSCVLAIYFSPSSFRQKEKNMQVVLLLISGQLGVPSPSPKNRRSLTKKVSAYQASVFGCREARATFDSFKAAILLFRAVKKFPRFSCVCLFA